MIVTAAAILAALVTMYMSMVFARSAAGGVPALARVLARSTSRIGAMAAGPVEVGGVVTATAPPEMSLSGQRCVAVHTVIAPSRGTGKGSTTLAETKLLRAVPCTLDDGTGRCRLDLDDAELAGQDWVAEAVPVEELPADAPRWLRAALPSETTHVTIHESLLPDGATILVTGDARAAGAVGGEGYRGSRVEWLVGGSEHSRLVASFGGQLRFLLGASLPVAITTLASVLLLLYGAIAVGIVLLP